MGFEDVLGIILPIVYIIVGAALIWFVIELVLTIRKARNTVTEVQKQLEPTLDSVQKITANIEPVTAKVDPLVDRVSLTVDAANLEILRVDQILEDATNITGSLSNAVDSVGAVTSAPVEFVNSVTDRVRKVFKRKDASDASAKLGAAPVDAAKNPVRNFVNTASDVATEAVAESQERYRERKEAQAAAREQATERAEALDSTASKMADAILIASDADAADSAKRNAEADVAARAQAAQAEAAAQAQAAQDQAARAAQQAAVQAQQSTEQAQAQAASAQQAQQPAQPHEAAPQTPQQPRQ